VIWARGEIVRDDALRISVADRTFEHGLGLFETFRTWNRRPALLERHLERMRNSARALRLPLEAGQLPDERAVALLIAANQDRLPADQDVRLRVILSGGVVTGTKLSSLVWMTAGPLPEPLRETGAVVSRSITVDDLDPLARHKTLNYWRKRIAYEEAAGRGEDEVLCVTADGTIREASRSNVFVVDRGILRTPDLDGPLLPGVMRAVVLDQAARRGLAIDTGPLPLNLPRTMTEAFLTSSLRGVVAIGSLLGRDLPSPGPVARRLWAEIERWLESGEDAS
jgi:branched-chain amino acid aminotransferase